VPIIALRLLAGLAGKTREVGSLTDSLRIDSSSLRDAVGWSPPYETEESVALTVRWFLAQAPRSARA